MEWRQLQSRSLTLDHRELLLFFPFFPLCLNPQAWFHLVERFLSWNWIQCTGCVNQCKTCLLKNHFHTYWALVKKILLKHLCVAVFESFREKIQCIDQLDLMCMQGLQGVTSVGTAACTVHLNNSWQSYGCFPSELSHNPSQQKAHVYIWKAVEKPCEPKTTTVKIKHGSWIVLGFFFFIWHSWWFFFFRSRDRSPF